MHVITRKRLNEFAERFPETKAALVKWYQLIGKTDFSSFAELRAIFPSADRVGKLTVFNVGGNKVRTGGGDSLQPKEGLHSGSPFSRGV